ncbi:pyruvate dehydrogenase E1 component beta subunit [Ilumatobacter fluminis]|uniref:Pyruvate dehydrogenase E1 component beta subunit n=1 Tax=Ilumatobacter fluminis TaxID=467091 RepID=A0A4R7I601_9ACTN|nr:alpha-ketoacid dehydrogenase subunit beta [Ilumatobacter fluminis]TDT18276.1 pyruvate dehydrogenase E1 component beta subunit [Ilumatobacter fluminis]
MREITMAQAINEALDEEMARDENVFLFGEDVAGFGGVFGVTKGLHDKYGKKRVFDSPLSETLIAGAAVGAAMTGTRPVAELQYSDFVGIAMDEVYNKAAKWRYMHGGKLSVPMVIRAPEGAKGGGGAEHSQSPGGLFQSAFGMYVLMPSNPADAKGLLKSAIRDENPVLFLEHKALYNRRGPVPDGEHLVPIGRAATVRSGSDVTVVAWGSLVGRAVAASEQLAGDGIDVEIIDPRGIRPLDLDTILASVERTGRLVLVHEAPGPGGPGAEVAAVVAERAIDVLEGPIARVTTPDTYFPQSVHLERMMLPTNDDIVAAVHSTFV